MRRHDFDLLPVELVDLRATVVDENIELTWETASESGFAGFGIEHQESHADSDQGGDTWQSAGFVERSSGSTDVRSYVFRIHAPTPGLHRFRLKMLDMDGSFTYSPEVEVTVEMPEAYFIEPAYPNPFNPQTTLRFAIREAESVTATLFDVRGRIVGNLFEGSPAPGEMQTLLISGDLLPSGTYFVRLKGERFVAYESMVLVK